MSHPGETVSEAITAVLGNYEPPNAKAFADTIAWYAVIAGGLRASITNLAQQAAGNRGIDPKTEEDLNEMAGAAADLFDLAEAARDNFYDNHRFWLEGDDGE